MITSVLGARGKELQHGEHSCTLLSKEGCFHVAYPCRIFHFVRARTSLSPLCAHLFARIFDFGAHANAA